VPPPASRRWSEGCGCTQPSSGSQARQQDPQRLLVGTSSEDAAQGALLRVPEVRKSPSGMSSAGAQNPLHVAPFLAYWRFGRPPAVVTSPVVSFASAAAVDVLQIQDFRLADTAREPPAAFWLGVRSCHTLGVPHACRASRTVFGSPRCYARFLHSAGKPGYKGLVVAWPQIQRLVARVASSAGTTQEELF